MAQTASQILARAMQRAKAPAGYSSQAAGELNAILQDLAEERDLAVARGFFSFIFNSQASSMLGGQNIGASGPYPLPLDYLRTSGSSGSEGTQKSTFWFINGVPYPMIPCDLSEFDMQVQQAGISSYPWLWATDMSQRVIARTTTGTVHSNTTLDNILDPTGIVAGMTVQGPGVPPDPYDTAAQQSVNTTVVSVTGTSLQLSQDATLTAAGGVYTFGYPGVGYAYPPPSGNYPVNLRYQRQMPDLATDAMGNLTTAAANSVPWFPHIGSLTEMLAARLMELTDDTRALPYAAHAGQMLDAYLKMKDDDTNRAKTVQLDRRRFGKQFPLLRNTKTIGW
jgi:hypothetical protein